MFVVESRINGSGEKKKKKKKTHVKAANNYDVARRNSQLIYTQVRNINIINKRENNAGMQAFLKNTKRKT